MKPTKDFVLREFPGGSITQFFGENHALYKRFGLAGHNGIDIVSEWNSPLYAVEEGTIVSVKNDPEGFGKHIRILTKSGNEWTYGHCERIDVSIGQFVVAGTQIGTMGNTGFTSGSATDFWGIVPKTLHPGTHCHLGFRKVVRDPKGFSYPGSSIKVKVLNYENGYKGAIDPVPELKKLLGEKVDTENLAKQITLLQKVVALLKLMKKA